MVFFPEGGRSFLRAVILRTVALDQAAKAAGESLEKGRVCPKMTTVSELKAVSSVYLSEMGTFCRKQRRKEAVTLFPGHIWAG